MSEGIEATAIVIGPTLGGFIVGLGRSTVSGSVLAFLVDALSYLVSGGVLAGVRQSMQPAGHVSHPPLLDAIREGVRFLWSHSTLRLLMLLTTAVNFLQAPLSLVVILVAQQRFGLPPQQIGLLFGIAGGAAVLGSLIAAWWYQPKRLKYILVGSLSLWSLAAFALALAPNPLTLAAGMALNQVVWPLYAVAVVAYRLTATPQHLQGRVISAFRTLSYGVEPLGLACGGLAVTFASPSVLFSIIGLGLCLSGPVVLRQMLYSSEH